ncbi:tRNA dihydrouridine synthase DusB [Porphyromonadaceae bacterium]
MKIGKIDFGRYPVVLAPMEDVTDPAFRLMCKEFGVDLVYTEFVSSDALIRNINSTTQKLRSLKRASVVIQIYGKEPDAMVEAVKLCEESNRYHRYQFRMSGEEGGRKRSREQVCCAISPSCSLSLVSGKGGQYSVTVKTRLGWDQDTKVITTLVEQLQDCGIAALSTRTYSQSDVHRRSRWTLIGEVKQPPHTHSIIGNGDVTSPERAKECFDRYGVDAVMIGRGSIGRPWIFKEVKHYLQHGTPCTPLTFDERLDIMKRMVNTNVERIDERRGILHIRRHLAATPLFKGIPNFRDTRVAMLRADTVEELFGIFDRVAEMISSGGEQLPLSE